MPEGTMKRILIVALIISTLMTGGLYLYKQSKKPVESKYGPQTVTPVQPVDPVKPPIDGKRPPMKFEEALAEVSVVDAKEKLTYLASDELEGRMSGKSGNKLAA
jgi:hypothetical protein